MCAARSCWCAMGKTSAGEGVHRAGAWRGGSDHLLRSLRRRLAACDKYPAGPWRPDTGVQRGSVDTCSSFPAIRPRRELHRCHRCRRASGFLQINLRRCRKFPSRRFPITMRAYSSTLGRARLAREWQGALPFTYHVGPGPVRVKMHLKQDYQFRTLWDVIGPCVAATRRVSG